MRKIIVVSVLWGAGLFAPEALAQAWQACAALPEAMVPAAVAINGRIYAWRSSDLYRGNAMRPATMYEYSPSDDLWTARSAMATVRLLSGVVELNGKIYVLGGITNGAYAATATVADVEAFDPLTGIWERKSSLPEGLYVAGVAALQGKIYVMGGVNRTQAGGARVDRTSNRVYQFDPATNAWTEKAPMRKYRSWFNAVALGGKIYAVGGNNGNTSQPENTIEAYDVAADVWSDQGAFTNGVDGQCQALELGGKVVTLSADAGGTIGEIDPASSTWTARTRMLTPIMDFGRVVANGCLYLVGGHPVTAGTYSYRVIKYVPATNQQEYQPDIGQAMGATVEAGGVIFVIGGVDAAANYVSRVVKLDVRPPALPVIVRQPVSQTVAPGSYVALTVQATGTGTLRYRWSRDGKVLAGATDATLALNAATVLQAGDYAATVEDANGSTESWVARLVVAAPAVGRLTNLSVRAMTRGRSAPLILGFALGGGSKPLLIRGIGPALSGFGVAGALPDPVLEVHAMVNGRDTITANNDQWGTNDVTGLRAAFASSGAFGLSDATSRDAALIHTCEGLRSVLAYDAADRRGVTLVELYDIGAGNSVRLTNLSARNFAGTGDDVLIAGFCLSGNVPRQVLIRGIGPKLRDFGVSEALADPKLEVYMAATAGNVRLAANDNWGEGDVIAVRAAAVAAGAFSLTEVASRDAALVLTLPGGVFTAQVSGVGAATGDALVEVYELPGVD